MDKRLVVVAIPTKGRSKIFAKNLTHIAKIFKSFDILVHIEKSEYVNYINAGTFGYPTIIENPHIIVITGENNCGVAVARNNLIEKAIELKKEYIIFCDDNCENILEKTPNEFLFGIKHFDWVAGLHNKYYLRYPELKDKVFDRFTTEIPYSAILWIMKLSIIKKVGKFTPSLKCGEDLDLFLRCLQLPEFKYAVATLAKYDKVRHIEGGMNLVGKKVMLYKEAIKYFIKKYGDFFYLNKTGDSIYVDWRKTKWTKNLKSL